MALLLKGVAWPSGQIQFSRADNDWAFDRIKAGMKQGQENRIRVNPKTAEFELLSSVDRESGRSVDWSDDILDLLRTADRVYLEYHDRYLRFRRAVHEVDSSRSFITLGSQEELNRFADEALVKVKYFFAFRRDASCFELDLVVDTGTKKLVRDQPPIEIPGRMEAKEDGPVIAFSASGSTAPVEVVEWRSKVNVGECGRFHSDDSFVNINLTRYLRPITIFREHREEFNNSSYTFAYSKFAKKLKRHVAKRTSELALEQDES